VGLFVFLSESAVLFLMGLINVYELVMTTIRDSRPDKLSLSSFLIGKRSRSWSVGSSMPMNI